MFKLLGTVLIVTAASMLGFLKSNKLKIRADELLRINSSLSMLENEISYSQKSLKDALLFVGRAENLPLFLSVSEKIGACSVYKAFSDTLSGRDIHISDKDKLILLEFSQNLGSLDARSQIKSIIHAKAMLQNAHREAYEDFKKYGRLYKSMGFLLGILFSLILF